jgi:membrane protease YdiL (CAAX protease family)
MELIVVSAGMVIFAAFAHLRLPWSLPGAAGLVLAAAAIGGSLRRAERPLTLLGLDRFSRRAALFGTVGLVLGTAAAVNHRTQLGIPPWPVGFAAFAPVACLIGVTEELIYRGWLQGTARPLGWPAAVVIAAGAHAAYKTALFAWPPGPALADYPMIALWTFGGGIVLGLLRQVSGHTVPSMVAHAAFDLVVYGGLAHAPWWVWS